MQLSNANALSAYLLGSGSDSRRLPVARAFQTQVVGDSAADLRRLAEEHGGWLQSNCERQVEAYRSALLHLQLQQQCRALQSFCFWLVFGSRNACFLNRDSIISSILQHEACIMVSQLTAAVTCAGSAAQPHSTYFACLTNGNLL